jgi:hypothetical protein
MPKISKVGKFRKAAADTATPANTPISKGKVALGSKESSLAATINAAVTTAAAAKTESNEASHTNDGTNLSRGKRKRLAKRGQYLKKERLILSSLKLTKEEEQKKRIDGLDAIKEALLATVKKTETSDTATETVEKEEEKEEEKLSMLRTNKSRQLLMQKEVAQMSLVLQHPSFQADPFATIREHLNNSLTKDVANQKKEQVKHVRERKEKEEKKKAAKKESGIGKKKRKKFKATRSRGK